VTSHRSLSRTIAAAPKALRRLAVAVVAVLLVGAVALSFAVLQDLYELRRTPRNDLVWVGTQVETQLLRFQVELTRVALGRGDETRLKKSWLSLQSWMPTLDGGILVDTMKAYPDYRGLADQIRTKMRDMKSLVAERGGLAPAIDELLVIADRTSPLARRLAVAGSLGGADIAAMQRREIGRDTLNLGIVLGLLLAVLGGVIVVVSRQANRLRAAGVALGRARWEAERANRAKSDFLAHMSHELRTPLNAVIGFSEAMRAEIFGPLGAPRYKEYCDDIGGAGKHLLHLIDAVLDLSRIERGKMEPEPTHVDLSELGATCLDMVRGQAQGKRIELVLAGRDDALGVHADPGHMRQIVLNLLSNAVKFTGEGGRVELGFSRADNGGVEIWVADNGPGIAPGDIQRIQEPFGRIYRGATQTQGGSGLGLSICRAIAEANGASFDLTSTLGGGTTARLHFPEKLVSRANPFQPDLAQAEIAGRAA